MINNSKSQICMCPSPGPRPAYLVRLVWAGAAVSAAVCSLHPGSWSQVSLAVLQWCSAGPGVRPAGRCLKSAPPRTCCRWRPPAAPPAAVSGRAADEEGGLERSELRKTWGRPGWITSNSLKLRNLKTSNVIYCCTFSLLSIIFS